MASADPSLPADSSISTPFYPGQIHLSTKAGELQIHRAIGIGSDRVVEMLAGEQVEKVLRPASRSAGGCSACLVRLSERDLSSMERWSTPTISTCWRGTGRCQS
jgi:hypothetical protein